jgi:hypothetical protein
MDFQLLLEKIVSVLIELFPFADRDVLIKDEVFVSLFKNNFEY